MLSDVGQKVGRAFGLVYAFSDELKSAYLGFGLDIPEKNGVVGEWALPISATYVIDRDGTIIYANTDADYRDRADPSSRRAKAEPVADRGKASDAARFTTAKMLYWIDFYKGTGPFGISTASANFGPSKDWAMAGYGGWPAKRRFASTPSAQRRKRCAPSFWT